jgi:xylulokinase
MGVDLGTSSIKVLVMDKTGIVKSITSQEYSIDMPQDGYAEQQPENWWNAAVKAIRESAWKSCHQRVLANLIADTRQRRFQAVLV